MNSVYVNEMVAHRRHLHKRPEEGWGITISKFEKLVNRENNKLRAEFTARINNNTLSPTMASVVHYHILWKRISEKMGWSYTKAKTS